jgi:hypothetical protein
MAAGDAYRTKAAELSAQARVEPNETIRRELKSLSLSYLRLADQADRNALNSAAFEAPVRHSVTQQQQQAQAPKNPDADDQS